jgi:hypothetical protein
VTPHGHQLDAGLRSVRRRLRVANYLRKWVVLGTLIGVVGGLGAIAFYTAAPLGGAVLGPRRAVAARSRPGSRGRTGSRPRALGTSDP